MQSANGSSWTDAGTYKSGVWCRIELAVDAAAGKYDLSLDGKSAVRGASFAEHSATVERLSFRTPRRTVLAGALGLAVVYAVMP